MENKGKYLGIVAILATLVTTIVVVYAGLGGPVEIAPNTTSSLGSATTYLEEIAEGKDHVVNNYIVNVTTWSIIRSCTIFVNDSHEVIICE